jgi:hypothetical protein
MTIAKRRVLLIGAASVLAAAAAIVLLATSSCPCRRSNPVARPASRGQITSKPVGPVTAPPPPQSTNCAPNPHLCGFPDSTNTGVPRGMVLTAVPGQATSGPGWVWDSRFGGSLNITTDGTTISGLDVSGTINVHANNVTIKNTRVTNSGNVNDISIYSVSNTTVEDSTITGTTNTGLNRTEVGIKDVNGGAAQGHTILRNDISDCGSCIQSSNGTVKDNYIHNMGDNYPSTDCSSEPEPLCDHLNGLSVGGGDAAPLLIQHNTIFNQYHQTDAVALFQDYGTESYKTIDNNLLAGGAYTIYGGGGSYGISDHIVITNNHFSRIFFPNSGRVGYKTAFDTSGVGNAWSGNIWDDTGASAP